MNGLERTIVFYWLAPNINIIKLEFKPCIQIRSSDVFGNSQIETAKRTRYDEEIEVDLDLFGNVPPTFKVSFYKVLIICSKIMSLITSNNSFLI